MSSDPNSPPPVVILSGVSKEVPSGLVFGFDINEQLLLEDSSCQMLDNVVVRENVSKITKRLASGLLVCLGILGYYSN